jgi:hypothetical protein
MIVSNKMIYNINIVEVYGMASDTYFSMII